MNCDAHNRETGRNLAAGRPGGPALRS